MVEVREITSLDALAGCRLAWQALWHVTPRASFFHTYDWLAAFWPQAPRSGRLRVLLVSAGRELVGIVPLWAEADPDGPTLRFPLRPWAWRFGVLGSQPAATLAVGMRHVHDAPAGCRRIALECLAPQLGRSCRATAALRCAGAEPVRRDERYLSLVRWTSTWHDYQTSRPQVWRDEISRFRRRLFATGAVRLVRHRPAPAACGDGDPRWDLWEHCVALTRGSAPGALAAEKPLSWLNRPMSRACHAAAARLGMLDVSVLLVDGRPLAFSYGYHARGELTLLQIGSEPGASVAGVGRVLVGELLADSFERGDRVVDLGPGDLPYQRALRTEAETTYAVDAPLSATRRRRWRWPGFSRGRGV